MKMTKQEKSDRIDELLDNYLFGQKMIFRGEASQEELNSQFKEIERELKKLGYKP